MGRRHNTAVRAILPSPMPDESPDNLRSARFHAARALGKAAFHYPELQPVVLDVTNIESRDAHLALAIQRTALQRWLTIEFLLDQHLKQPLHKLQPALRGVLLAGGAQLLYMDRLPAYAVVSESVGLARKLVRQDAMGMANAVLRRLAEMIVSRHEGEAWTPAADRIPTETGYLTLAAPVLPDPATKLPQHLALTTSHPLPLVRRWLDKLGPDVTIPMLLHNGQTPPVIVAMENDRTWDMPAGAPLPFAPHQQPGFMLWQADYDGLIKFLIQHPGRRVQDPASAQPVRLTTDIQPKLILDYCAGRGTKSRQMALLHPQAEVIATDIDERRLEQLHKTSKGLGNLTVTTQKHLEETLAGRKADLLALDVPCTNTAVLARRPEARYRFSQSNLDKLVNVQRQIMAQALPHLAEHGWILYSTCSVEETENQKQARWLAEQCGGKVVREHVLLPGGAEASYHDGSFAALLER